MSLPVNEILHCNALHGFASLPKRSVNLIITSVPYKGMRDYNTDPQIWLENKPCDHVWLEKTKKQHAGRGDGQKSGKYSEQEDQPDLIVQYATCQNCQAIKCEVGQEPETWQYIENLCQIFDRAREVLRDDGALYVNIGDKYDDDGSLLNIPGDFCSAMLKRGWKKINDIIWLKRSVLPQSDPRKFSPNFEYVFFFAKRGIDIQYYTNAKLGLIQKDEPLGITGIEGIDWDWRPLKKEPASKNNCKQENEIWYRKTSNWSAFDYWHETQYEPLAESTLKQIQQIYSGKSAKYEQATLDGLSEGLQNASDTKRNIIQSMKERSMPAFGGKKAAGYGNPVYSGESWDAQDAVGAFKRTVWDVIPARFPDAHFAVWPEELAQIMIKANCPEHVCTNCGLAWRHLYSEERRNTRPGLDVNNGKTGNLGDPNEELHKSELSRNRQVIIRKESGWLKCACQAPTRPGVVLDPFMGSGQSALAALNLGRKFIGFELNPDYRLMALERLKPFLEQKTL